MNFFGYRKAANLLASDILEEYKQWLYSAFPQSAEKFKIKVGLSGLRERSLNVEVSFNGKHMFGIYGFSVSRTANSSYYSTFKQQVLSNLQATTVNNYIAGGHETTYGLNTTAINDQVIQKIIGDVDERIKSFESHIGGFSKEITSLIKFRNKLSTVFIKS